MTAQPWYPFYVSDYESKTAELNLIQHGAYRRLMDHYYSTRSPLPANASVLHRICRAFEPAEKAAIKFVLARYFVLDGEVYRHQRIDEELARAADISRKRSNAANSRYANAPANAEQMHTQSHSPSLPTKKVEIINLLNGLGKKNGKYQNGTSLSKTERVAIFQKTLAESFIAGGVKDGWMIVAAGSDSALPDHDRCLKLCIEQAKSIGKGWPSSLPT